MDHNIHLGIYQNGKLKSDLKRFINLINQASAYDGHPVSSETIGWFRIDHISQKYLLIDEIQSDVFTAIGKTKDILRCKNGNEYIKTLSPQAIQAIQEKGYNTRDLIANFSYTKQHILQTVKSLENLDKIKQAFIQQYIDSLSLTIILSLINFIGKSPFLLSKQTTLFGNL